MKSIGKILLLFFFVIYFQNAFGQADPGSGGLSFSKPIFTVNGTGTLEVLIGNYSGGFTNGTALTPYDATFTITIPYILKVNGKLDFSQVPFAITIVSQMSTFSGSTIIVLTVPDGIPKGVSGAVKIPLMAVKGEMNILYATVRTEFNLSYPPSGNIIPNNDMVSAPVSVITPLPVALSSFKVAIENNQVNLNWATTAEANSDRFEIERSFDGKQWALIGNVLASGESEIKRDYYFSDRDPLEGDSYYRLKMIDRDQTFAYSSIRNIRLENLGTEIFPNPVSDRLSIRLKNWENVTGVELMNLSGNKVYDSGKLPLKEVDVTNIPKGIYILKISKTSGTALLRKVLINR